VRKISPDGTISNFAGTGMGGFSGDGGPATKAQLLDPQGLAADAAGNVYIADHGNVRIRKVSPDGTITTVAGTGEPLTPGRVGSSSAGERGPATKAPLYSPRGLAVDAAGNLYVADQGRVVEI